MGSFKYIDGVAVWKLVFYAPALTASLFVAYKHGLAKGSGWIYLTIFSVIRIVGAAAQLALISNPDSSTASTTALICSVLGLSPLLLASLGLIARSFYSILKQPWSTLFSLVILRLVQTPCAVALILCIVGATSANSPADITSESTVKIGIILYTVVFVLLCVLTFAAAVAARMTKRGEGALIIAVTFALPFLLVRIIYALIATFGHSADFIPGNTFTAAVTISLFMEVLDECFVVVVYVATGLKLACVPAGNDGTGQTILYRLGRGDFSLGALGLLSLGAAFVSARPKGRSGDSQQKDPEKGRGGNRAANMRSRQQMS